MSLVSQARVPTPHARKYALQLGRHWQHNLAVEESGNMRRITFPRDARGAAWSGEALVTLQPEDGILLCRIEASEPGQLKGLKGAVERHVARFAFREDGLSYDWEDVAPREPGASE